MEVAHSYYLKLIFDHNINLRISILIINLLCLFLLLLSNSNGLIVKHLLGYKSCLPWQAFTLKYLHLDFRLLLPRVHHLATV